MTRAPKPDHLGSMHRFTDESQRVLRTLGSVKGVTIDGPSGGRMKIGTATATVRLEVDSGSTDHWIWVELQAYGAPPPHVALAAGSSLPGNTRYASIGGDTVLVADTRTDGVAHLHRSLEEMRSGLVRASGSGRRTRAHGRKKIDRDVVAKILDGITRKSGSDLELVALDDGWELRPRVDDAPVALHVTIEDAGLRFRKSFGPLLGEGDSDHPSDVARAVATEALRLNGRLRLSRIAQTDGELCVETFLHDEIIDAPWIVTATRAVAIAFNHCRGPLRALARNEPVARCYAQMFLEDPEGQRTPRKREIECSQPLRSTSRT